MAIMCKIWFWSYQIKSSNISLSLQLANFDLAWAFHLLKILNLITLSLIWLLNKFGKKYHNSSFFSSEPFEECFSVKMDNLQIGFKDFFNIVNLFSIFYKVSTIECGNSPIMHIWYEHKFDSWKILMLK